MYPVPDIRLCHRPRHVNVDSLRVKVDPRHVKVYAQHVKVDPRHVKVDSPRVKVDPRPMPQTTDTRSNSPEFRRPGIGREAERECPGTRRTAPPRRLSELLEF